MPRGLRAGIHDVAQTLARINVVLICRKAVLVLANRVLEVSLSGSSGVHTISHGPKKILAWTGLLLGGSARNACACHDRRNQE
jgi:hypothetical protein